MPSKLAKLRELPRLPGHRTSVFRDVEISGVTVRVHKARSNRTTPVSARMLAMLSDELYQLVAHSDTEGKDAGPLAALLEVDFADDEQAKNVIMGIALPLLYKKSEELAEMEGPGSLFWYFEQILEGNVELEGVRPETMDDLDEMGFGVMELTKLFWKGVEMAFFPTLGDPDTNPGESGPGTPESSPVRKTENMHGESARMTGRQAPTSTTTG